MKSLFVALFLSFVALGSGAFAQQIREFRTTPRVPPPVEPPRSAVEQNANSDIARKFIAAPNKLQLLNPLAPRRYGSGEQVVAPDLRSRSEVPRFWRILSFPF